MNNYKVNIVSGEPRSGTSLMMKLIQALGMEILGEKYPATSRFDRQIENLKARGKDTEKRINHLLNKKEKIKELNPVGFYELPGIVVSGLRNITEEYNGRVIKIITNGLYERVLQNGRTIGTPLEYINKIIFCIRNPRSIAKSQTNLDNRVEVANNEEWEHRGIRYISSDRYIHSMGSFCIWLCDNFESYAPLIYVVDFDDVVSNNPPLREISSHLGIKPLPSQLRDAKGIIDHKLYRSKNIKDWPLKVKSEGELADDIYNAFKNFSLNSIKTIKMQVIEYFQYKQIENIRWVDDEFTWLEVYPDFWRNIANNINNLKDNLIKTVKRKEKSKLIPSQCKFYSRDNNNTYVIKRPLDLGDLTRSMVLCKRDNELKSVEMCKHCWLRGSLKNGKFLTSQRERQSKNG